MFVSSPSSESSSRAFLLIPDVEVEIVLPAGEAAPDLLWEGGTAECARVVDGLIVGGRIDLLFLLVIADIGRGRPAI